MVIETTPSRAGPPGGNRPAHKRRLTQYSLYGTLGLSPRPPKGCRCCGWDSRFWRSMLGSSSSRQEAREEGESFRRGQVSPDSMSGRGFASFPGSQVSRFASFQVRKFPGSQASRLARFQVRKFPGSHASMSTSFRVRTFPGSQVSRLARFPGSEFSRFTRFQVHKFSGSHVSRLAGS